MSRHRLALTLLFLLSLLSTLPAVAQDDVCTGVLAPRLTVGQQGRVTPGNANNVRAEAGRGAALVGQIPGGESFDVLDGPICADGLNWWHVRYGSLTGWTVEAVGIDYWLEPYDPYTPVVLAATHEIDYEYEGIRFEVDPQFATRVTAVHLAPVVDDPNYDPPSPIAPEGIKFNFSDTNGDILPFTIRVFSVKAYKEAYEFAESEVNELSQLLADDPGWVPPAINADIPLLGVVEPPLLMRARLGELGFANGSGYRFLAQYSFDVREINNPLDYHFSGITYDQQYYIIASASVTTPLLPKKVTQSGTDFEHNFENYRTEVIKMLKEAADEEFNLNLAFLDSIIQSLQVKGPAYSVVSAEGMTTVKYGEMGFNLDSSLAKDIDYEVDLASWETMSPLPEHVCFKLQKNPLSHAWSGSQLCIIPVEGMEGYVATIDRLVTEKPVFDASTGRNRIPIPFNGAAQLLHSNVNYVETDTLRGVGFVSAYAQMEYPITSGSTEYNFSGITTDGKYIIYLEYPLYTDLLPAGPPTDDDVYQVNLDPQAYYKRVENKLNAGSASDFVPSLDTLTALVQSIHTR